MTEIKKSNAKFTTHNLFHITAIKQLYDIDFDEAILTNEKSTKVLAVYKEHSPEPLKNIKVVCGDKECSLLDFFIRFKEIRSKIFKIIDEENGEYNGKH